VTVVFCTSSLGGREPRVLARFVSDETGLHAERFDQTVGRWVSDSRVAAFLTGQDDWSERISDDRARQIVASWGFSPTILMSPVTEAAKA
jgi:hypothetical protein